MKKYCFLILFLLTSLNLNVTAGPRDPSLKLEIEDFLKNECFNNSCFGLYLQAFLEQKDLCKPSSVKLTFSLCGEVFNLDPIACYEFYEKVIPIINRAITALSFGSLHHEAFMSCFKEYEDIQKNKFNKNILIEAKENCIKEFLNFFMQFYKTELINVLKSIKQLSDNQIISLIKERDALSTHDCNTDYELCEKINFNDMDKLQEYIASLTVDYDSNSRDTIVKELSYNGTLCISLKKYPLQPIIIKDFLNKGPNAEWEEF